MLLPGNEPGVKEGWYMSAVFSVIIPVYNVEMYLPKCLDSILSQTFKDFEVILVDDGSKDNCPEICDNYAAEDNRVKVIHKENGGLVNARNTGIRAATGEYICYVDGDDWIAENLLQVMWDKAVRDYKPDMIAFGMIKKFKNKEVEIPQIVSEGLYDKGKLEKEIYPYMIYDKRQSFFKGLIFLSACTKIYKKAVLEKHFCTEEHIHIGEDAAFIYDCAYASESIYFCRDNLYYYNRLNSDSMTGVYNAGRFENNQLLLSYIENKLGGKSENLDMQINAYRTYCLTVAVFHEVKCGRKLSEAATHIKAKLKLTNAIGEIQMEGLPFSIKVFLILLRLHCYVPVLAAAKVISKFRN
ncbi:putative glycosyltransferase EpsJ [Acetatifactor muris]|jgi:glycosyltransferase involved in cell wall biosynthesis|uniref:Putative glycosyltransferase EpsJ n=2 Tax=Acetatifactor muris TaxID=879566 RepID=A0A2K4ZMJ5_9FIRM|nr:putative glycosyltransferase EpsJ [Acetatifactor muris]